MKQRVEEMEREANKLRELQAAAEKSEHQEGDPAADGTVPMETDEDKAQADARSIFVGNVSSLLGGEAEVNCNGVRRDRWTTARPPRRSSSTSSRVAPSTG